MEPVEKVVKRKHGVREARLWEPLPNNRVKCNLCHRRCIIAENRYGVCGVRANYKGKLYTLVYGLLTAANVDPIEKKPLMHFYPGSSVLSISTAGCNFFCQFCQNWTISQIRYDSVYGNPATPEDIVKWALETNSDGISYTYNEPTVFFEFMYDAAKLAKKHGLFNTMVTNGYMAPEAVDELGPYMDAVTVDFKGGGNREFYRKFIFVSDPEKIFETLQAMKDKGWWIEITNLVVPKYGDKKEDIKKLARWIVENLGPETPLHLLRFHPDYKMIDVPPTPIEKLEELARVAEEEGLKHVYLGNVPGHPKEHTYCPRCGTLLIKRYGFYILEYNITKDGKCPKCGYKVNIKGEFRGKKSSLYWYSMV